MLDTRLRWQGLRRSWRIQCATTFVLPIILVWFVHDRQGAYETVGIPLFIVGLLTLLLTVWRYGHYRSAVLNMDATANTDEAESAWNRLQHQQLLGLSNAKLPGWVGMLHYVCTLELTPLILLVLASLAAMLLYRPPSVRFS